MKSITWSVALLLTLALAAFVQPDSEINKKGKWVKLFDGKTLNGWKKWKGGEITKWKVEDGAMVLAEKGGGDLLTEGQYGDFELELEWKISEGGNSGVMYHVQEGQKYCCPYSTGPEIQVLDDAKHPDSFKGADGNHKAGSLYDLLPPNDLTVVKPAGQWNKMRLVIKKGKGESWLNGKKVVDFPTKGPEWDAMVAKSKFKGWDGFAAFDKGHIALQDHGDKVWFRNIRIREL
ncbi:DUF1080 domain-containing protein [Rhabdobacter roseus]|uniref:3-keto-alpha-glucoside-1,2-lyase/3-keto-2-hydroxy-glucal hydratase domain-containing protein n=1 Tax=Rhabdobacter roseus TaxID=1655419 RepID=A0A840TX77_9BACT|nr:DUF1080 domain-containing protein [Rhabdobacter roseus]MBB5284249.1 hypothetical protein [Rhabdobacter roseus]